MSRKLIRHAALAACAMISACTTSQEVEVIPTRISLDVEGLSFTQKAGSQSVKVTSGSKWSISAKPEWLTVESIDSKYALLYEWPVSLSAESNDGYNREGSVAFQAGGKTATLFVSQQGAKGAYVAVESVSISPTELTLTEGESASLTAVILPSNASTKSVSWTSSNTAAAVVSSSGVVTAKVAGRSTITITVKTDDGSKTATCTVTVKAKTITVTGVSLDKTSLTLTEGDTYPLIATVTPSNATDKSVTWSSNNTSIATVSSSGVVTAKAAGTATITVTTSDGSKKATCAVTVKAKTISVTGVSLNKTSLSLLIGGTERLTATVTPSNATNKNVTWLSSNSSVATVDSNGNVSAVKVGTAVITATTEDGGKIASCMVSVVEKSSVEYADLGLPSGLKWATCNLGASFPEEYGDYYAWGETEIKTDYSWLTYKWCEGTYMKLTKYNRSSSYGIVDNKTTLEKDDDVAHVKLGGTWRMPTEAEWTELMENCSWTWTTKNGVNGYMVSSQKNEASIFLPAAGYWNGTAIYTAGSFGHYWSSSLRMSFSAQAWKLGFADSRSVDGFYSERCYGDSIRPVSD